jgi:hypothetical protein
VRATALAGALSALADATDAVALAVRRHDHSALVEANLRADALLAAVGRTMAAVGPDDKHSLEAAGVGPLIERLGASGRRNAYLIERAWAIDAAMLRLLAGLGRQGVEGTAAGYGAPAGPAYLDRQA